MFWTGGSQFCGGVEAPGSLWRQRAEPGPEWGSQVLGPHHLRRPCKQGTHPSLPWHVLHFSFINMRKQEEYFPPFAQIPMALSVPWADNKVDKIWSHLGKYVTFSRLYTRGWPTFSVKAKTLNIWGFVSHMLCVGSYSTLPLWGKSSHRLYASKWAWLCANKTLFSKTDSE